MRLSLDVLLLAALPTTLAARLAYTPPTALMAKAMASDDCILPASYKIQNFNAKSNDTGVSLGTYDFKYIDSETKVETHCHFNSSSESTTPSGLTPRFLCENGEIKFIWENEKLSLTMIERVCPGDNGAALYEVAGTVRVPLQCKDGGSCSTNSTSYSAKFSNVSPVIDPTRH